MRDINSAERFARFAVIFFGTVFLIFLLCLGNYGPDFVDPDNPYPFQPEKYKQCKEKGDCK